MRPIILVTPFPKNASGINEATVSQPLGIAYIAALLEKEGFACHIIDANILKLENDKVLKKIIDINAGIVGISINVVTGLDGLDLARRIKEKSRDILVILGGPQANICVEENLISSGADAVVFGEGEITMFEIAKRYKENSQDVFGELKGVIYRRDNEIIVNGPRERILDLDSLPHPAYHLLPELKFYLTRARKKPAASIITSRGCPFECIYCNKNIFGSYVTALSANRVIDLIDTLVNKYGVRQIDIYDDNFVANKKRVNEIFDKILENKYNLAINLQTGLRADSIDRELIFKMKKAGVFKIGFGVESGSSVILKIAKKQLDLNKVLEATRLAKEARIMTYGFFILGLPGENAQTLQQTIDFAKKMDPEVANFCIAMPFPETELYEMIKKHGKFLIDTSKHAPGGFYGSRAFFEYNGLNEATLLKYFRKAYYSFYFRPKKIVQSILSIKSWDELMWFLGAGLRLIFLSVFAKKRRN